MSDDNQVDDVEGGKAKAQAKAIPHFRQVLDQAGVTADVEQWKYEGSGTEEDPFVVVWIDHDPRNPMLYSQLKKWTLTMLVALATLAVAFVSSAFSGGTEEIASDFGASEEVVTLGLSLFVLGFAVGPVLWAPLSELLGRQYLYIGTYLGLTAFNAGAGASQNIWTIIILRFFAGAIGSSPLTNAGGVIADMFPARERGLAMSLFAAAPFMGPVIGPIVGGFVGQTVGWRWIQFVMAIFTGVLWVVGSLAIPETYPPVILRQRAKKLSKLTGKVYKSRAEIQQGHTTITEVFKTSLSRPWILLFREPIVLLLSIYMAIIYGTLYMCFGAFPIVYQQYRGWSPGIGGLAFLGLAVGMVVAVAYSVWENKRYAKISDEHQGFAPPEARLPLCMVGSIAVPIGLFWFAWTNSPSIPWIVSIMAGAPFGFGMVLIFLGIMNYLIDSYTIFAASVLAANSVLRSLFGAAFPLFTSQMYANLGIHWASSIPAFLALMCVPFPFLFYKYGAKIRTTCKYAAQSEKFMRQMMNQTLSQPQDDEKTAHFSEGEITAAETTDTDEKLEDSEFPTDVSGQESRKARRRSRREEEEEEDRRASVIDSDIGSDDEPRFVPITATKSRTAQSETRYDASPFDLDRVNTRESFRRSSSRSRANSRSSSKSRG